MSGRKGPPGSAARPPAPRRRRAVAAVAVAKRTAGLKRLDGVTHWRKIMDRLIWMLLRAGIEPGDIVAASARTLERRRGTRALPMPTPEVLEYVRVVTFWRNEPRYLDARGRPLVLPPAGKAPSFRHLVELAVPSAAPRDVLELFRRQRLVSIGPRGRIRLLGNALLPRSAQRAKFVAYSLGAIEGLVDTCYTNLNAAEPARSLGLLQRTAMAERFDLEFLPQYDLFMREQAEAFLLKQDAWLRRHEIKEDAGRRRARAAYVGIGVYGFRAR